MKVIHVAVGAIVCDDRVLLAKRGEHQHQGGLWEFPGGKVEASEDVQTALTRELKEELDILPTKISPLIQISHQYADKAVMLDVWRVEGFSGEPRGVEGQPLEWVAISDLRQIEFPAANKPIVSALMLPSTIAITPANGDLTQLKAFIVDAIKQGAQSIHVRAPQLAQADVWSLYQFSLRSGVGCSWLNSGHVVSDKGEYLLDAARLAQVQAIHWKHAHRYFLAQCSAPWASVSCHSLDDLLNAAELGFDCATLSPVKKTTSHPEAVPLGWEQFSQWTAKATIPVYALGGVGHKDLPIAAQAFAQGIAGISLFSSRL